MSSFDIFVISLCVIILIFIGLVIILGIIGAADEQKKLSTMTPEEKEKYKQEQAMNIVHGICNQAMVCPHCNMTGKVRTKTIKQKKGIGGGKATAAVLTGGISLFAVGLSLKEGATRAYCNNCCNTWTF